MTRTRTTPFAILCVLSLALLAAGCASTATVVPGRSLALLDVQYPESRMTGVVMSPGEEPATARMARALVREIGSVGLYQVTDARNLGIRPASLGKDAAQAAALLKAAPADAYLGVRLLDCASRAMSETERRGSGPSAVEVTVYFFRGECTAELTAFGADGATVATLQKTGRWDSPRQERPDASSMQSQALSNAVDDTARKLAREVRPSAAAK